MNIQLDTNGNPLQINGLYDEISKIDPSRILTHNIKYLGFKHDNPLLLHFKMENRNNGDNYVNQGNQYGQHRNNRDNDVNQGNQDGPHNIIFLKLWITCVVILLLVYSDELTYQFTQFSDYINGQIEDPPDLLMRIFESDNPTEYEGLSDEIITSSGNFGVNTPYNAERVDDVFSDSQYDLSEDITPNRRFILRLRANHPLINFAKLILNYLFFELMINRRQIGGGNKFNSKNIDKLSNAFNGAFNKLSKDDKTEIEQICKNFQSLICIQQPSSNIGGLRKKKLYKTIKLKNKRKSKRKGKK